MPIAIRVSATEVRFKPAVEVVVVVPSRMVSWGLKVPRRVVVVRLFEGDVVVGISPKSRGGCSYHGGRTKKVPICSRGSY